MMRGLDMLKLALAPRQPRYLVRPGMLDAAAIERLKNATPGDIVELPRRGGRIRDWAIPVPAK